jgi:hypothetical protein
MVWSVSLDESGVSRSNVGPRGSQGKGVKGFGDVMRRSLHVFGVYVLNIGTGVLGRQNMIDMVYWTRVDCVAQVPRLGCDY